MLRNIVSRIASRIRGGFSEPVSAGRRATIVASALAALLFMAMFGREGLLQRRISLAESMPKEPRASAFLARFKDHPVGRYGSVRVGCSLAGQDLVCQLHDGLCRLVLGDLSELASPDRSWTETVSVRADGGNDDERFSMEVARRRAIKAALAKRPTELPACTASSDYEDIFR